MRTVGEIGWIEPIFVFDRSDSKAAFAAVQKRPVARAETTDYPGTPEAGSPTIMLDGSVFSGTHFHGADRDAILFTISETTKISVTFTHSTSGTLSIVGWNGSSSPMYYGWPSTNTVPLIIELQPGTYYFDSTATDQGTYTISAALIDDDQPDEGYVAVSELEIGDTVSGTIDHIGDDDWFVLNVDAGQTIEFSATGLDFGAYLHVLRIDPFGFSDFMVLQTEGSEPGRIHFTAAGNYRVGLVTSISGANYTGTDYTIAAVNIPDPESDNISTSAVITADGPAYLGEITHTFDDDWIRLEIASTSPVRVTIADRAFSSSIRIRDAAGNVVAATQDATFIFQPPSTGTYFIEIDAAVLSSTVPNTYTLTVETLADDFGSSHGSAGVLTIGGSAITGTINFTGDSDWFSITSPTDQVIRIVVEGLGPFDYIPMILFDFFDASGQIIHSIPDYFYQDPEVYSVSVVTIPAGGSIHFSPIGVPAGASYGIVATAVSDDQTGPPPALLTDGPPVSGVIDYEGDVDTFLVTVADDGILVIRTPMLNASDLSMLFTPLLYAESGDRIYALNDGPTSDGTHWMMSYSGMPAGTYQVRMTPNNDALGSFSLSADIVHDNHPNLPGAPATILGYGGQLAGSLDYGGDLDIVGIFLDEPGANYRLHYAPVNGSFVAPSVYLVNEFGVRYPGQPSTVSTPSISGLLSGVGPGTYYFELGANAPDAIGFDVVGDWILNITYLLGNGNNAFSASEHGDQIDGQLGNDTVQGLAGDDILFGSAGADTLSGGRGDDRLYGGADSDKLHGGSGRDIFVVGDSTGTDTVSDFQPTWDRFEVLAGSGDTAYSDLEIIQDGADVLITFLNGGALRLVNTLRELVGPQHFTFLGAPSAEAPHAPAAAESAEFRHPSPDFDPDHFEFTRNDEASWHLA